MNVPASDSHSVEVVVFVEDVVVGELVAPSFAGEALIRFLFLTYSFDNRFEPRYFLVEWRDWRGRWQLALLLSFLLCRRRRRLKR